MHDEGDPHAVEDQNGDRQHQPALGDVREKQTRRPDLGRGVLVAHRPDQREMRGEGDGERVEQLGVRGEAVEEEPE